MNFGAMTGKQAHATKTIEILNAWSDTLESVSDHDAKLLIGMAGMGFCNAAELIRHTDAGWLPEDQKRFERMLREILYPGIQDFYPTANGNWDASMIQTMLAMSSPQVSHCRPTIRAMARICWPR